MNMKTAEVRTEIICARASTKERMVAEQVANALGRANSSQLVRFLITEKAKVLCVG